ncbi:hypothetical protein NSP_35180 [Nodularia spumigena CCY9414]|nr:hypothetical protein NSP_35180 [Nodularia spumigena CCY9414]
MKHYQLVVIGDREFHGIELASWLHRQGLKYVFRTKKGHYFSEKKARFSTATYDSTFSR